MLDQTKFVSAMTGLGAIFEKSITESMVKLYWQVLKDFSDDEVHEAINRALITCKFMPKPSELREIIQGSSKDHAVDEWAKVISEMRRTGSYGNPRLSDVTKKVVDQIGGWSQLCALSYRELEFKGKSFAEIYESKVGKGLIGLDCDGHNGKLIERGTR